MKRHEIKMSDFANFSKRIDLASDSSTARKLEYEIEWYSNGTTIQRYLLTVDRIVYPYVISDFAEAILAYNEL